MASALFSRKGTDNGFVLQMGHQLLGRRGLQLQIVELSTSAALIS